MVRENRPEFQTGDLEKACPRGPVNVLKHITRRFSCLSVCLFEVTL